MSAATERPPTIVFLHIPKTAGLTLRELIRRQYPKSQVLVPHQPRGRGREDYLRFLRDGGEAPEAGRPRNESFRGLLRAMPRERLEEARVVMGHFWFGLHEELPGPSTYITVVRDPIDRVLSMYFHRATRHGLGMSVEEFVRAERDIHLDNDQVRRLANTDEGDIRFGPCTPEMYERAVRNVEEHVSVIGVTERFDDMVLALGKRFGWRRLAYVSRNVAPGRPRREELDRDVLRLLEGHNEYDLELHRLAQARFADLVERLGLDLEPGRRALGRRKRWYGRTRPAWDRFRTVVAHVLGRRTPADVRRRDRIPK
jgi:sulfotransferase famil protein